MTLSRTFLLLITATAASAQAPIETLASPAETLSYRCARDVATIVGHGRQTGPLFSEDDLVFAGLVAKDGSSLLMLNDGSGTYAFRLSRQGVNRVRFTLPHSLKARTYFLSYAHDELFGSRLFEFSSGRAPVGREDVDYDLVRPSRAPLLLPHFEYAILQTSETALSAITEGKIPRAELNRHRVRDCDHLKRRAPILARGLKHNLDMLELIVLGPAPPAATSSRLPASVR